MQQTMTKARSPAMSTIGFISPPRDFAAPKLRKATKRIVAEMAAITPPMSTTHNRIVLNSGSTRHTVFPIGLLRNE